MDSEHFNAWCWILTITAASITGILGYLMGKRAKSTNSGPVEWGALKEDNAKLQTALETCREKLSLKIAEPPVGRSMATPSSEAKQASAALGKKVKQDDLKIVEGIGPKIEQLFHNSGIKTWKALSDVSVNKCQDILNAGGNRFKMHDPASWPMQAKMCHEGKWKELAHWQEDHKHGKF